MKGKRFLSLFLVGIALAIVLPPVLLSHVPCQAAEMAFPIKSWEGEELAKVREWEKEWVGKKIDSTNLDGVKEFLPEELYKILKNSEKWGDGWFMIVPYKQIIPSPGDIKFTKQYAGQPKVGPDGYLMNYVSGVPFPHPKTPLEIMYNFDNLDLGDNANMDQYIGFTDGIRKYDRLIHVMTHAMYFAARRNMDPVPDIEPNPKGIFRGSHSWYSEPASFKGNRSLNIKWIKRDRDYGSWSFSSATRRVTRRSTKQRQDHIGGADVCFDDTGGYAWDVKAQDYKLLGRKDLLLARDQDAYKIKDLHVEGECLYPGFDRERINTYVVEAFHKDPNYIYSKQLYYFDPETWWMLYVEKWDRQGRLWKIFDQAPGTSISVLDKNVKVVLGANFSTIVDVQRHHSTGVYAPATIGLIDKQHRVKFYEPRALQKFGY